MSDYCPDRWVIVRVASKHDEPIDKVMGSWYGGYAGSDSWRFSSGITKIIEHDDRYEVHNYSGSIYELFKGAEGMAAYTAACLKKMTAQLEESGEGTIELIDIDDVNTIADKDD